jgi:hypothetical protein
LFRFGYQNRSKYIEGDMVSDFAIGRHSVFGAGEKHLLYAGLLVWGCDAQHSNIHCLADATDGQALEAVLGERQNYALTLNRCAAGIFARQI